MPIHEQYPLGFPIADIPVPTLPQRTLREAIFFARKNLPDITWNTMRLLENNPTTLPQTQVILNGNTVAGLKIDDMMQVKRFADGFKLMLTLVSENQFNEDIKTACKIHSIVAAEEALEWGVIRTQQVHVGRLKYIPPSPADLSQVLEAGFKEAQTIDHTYQRAIATFAFMSKAQPFFDGNKRTAVIMSNGILLACGLCPIYTPAKLEEQFNKALTSVYEDADLEPLGQFFFDAAQSIYPASIDYGHRLSSGASKKEEQQ